MSQCVPSWDLDDSHHSLPVPELPHPTHNTNFSSLTPDVHHSLNYEVAELTWLNGQLGMHGLGTPRVPTKYTLDKPRAGGTLESIVSQATRVPNHPKPAADDGGGDGGDELGPWFHNHRADSTPKKVMTASVTMTIDALVPCGNNTTPNNSDNHRRRRRRRRREHSDGGVRVPGCSTPVGSCSGTANGWADRSVSVSATCGGDSLQVTVDTSSDRELGARRFTSTSMGSPENTSFDDQCTDRTAYGHDSVCRSKSQREAGDEEDNKKGSKVSTKRSRAAAIHNQSERKRRDKISQRMKTLQKLVPNSNKTDKASMLDEVIEYLKQLQAQVQMMGRMNNNIMSPMMSPMAMQQHLQMSMMTPMGMGMGMGLGMGMGIGMGIPGMPPVLHPAAAAAASFMPVTSWDGTTDPYAALLACQSQPMTMDAYSRMATLYQQFQQPHAGSAGLKN